MEFSAKQIAELIGAEIEGNPEVFVDNLSKIEEGKSKTISFLANPKYTKYIYETDASIVIIEKSQKLDRSVKATCTLLRVDDVRSCFTKLLGMYDQVKNNKTGIHTSAVIEESSKLGSEIYVGGNAYIGENCIIGENVKIYPTTFIGDNVLIGNNSIIYAGVKIYDSCVVGANCIIHSGAVIGADGFGFAPCNLNTYEKVPQIGNVILEDRVEIGANTCIDRATLGSTIIRKGVKLDNLIQVAHNVEIGENTVIAALSGISGSTKIGRNCIFGGQVGMAGHLKLGNNVKIAAQSGIQNDLPDNTVCQGSPAFPVIQYKKSYILFKQLPELEKRLWKLEKQIKNND